MRRCDFLQVPISEEFNENDGIVSSLKRESYDVVVFSLLLEYLPRSEQRLTCCEKAYEILKGDGLFVIVTPDSSHQNKNMNMIKSWKAALENLGFARWRYEKLQHLHCMAFRKCYKKLGLKSNHTLLFIPQDLKKKEDNLANKTNMELDFSVE